MRSRFRKVVLSVSVAALSALTAAIIAPTLLAAPLTGRPAPGFTLRDLQLHPHSLAELRGRPVALFFFCGCEPCHRCASLWAEAQQSGVLASESSVKPVTVAVFMGEAASARAFAAETGLDPKQTLFLTDPEEKAASAYGVTACPRFFVVDSHGILCRTNNEPGTDPQTTPAAVIVSRAQTALHLLDKPAPQKAVLHVPKR